MSKLRPYLVRFMGRDRLVNATSPGPAQNHIVKAEVARVKAGIESCRAATGADVAAFFGGGGKIETVGDPVPESTGGGLLGRLVAEGRVVNIVPGAEIEEGDVLVRDSGTGLWRKADDVAELIGFETVKVPAEFKRNATGDTIWWGEFPEDERDGRHEQLCPGHVASDDDAKVCRHCGVNVDALRGDESEEEK